MLTVFSGSGSRTCDGLTRRDFMRVGALSLGSLALPDFLALKARAGNVFRDKSVVLLYLSGGASHIETFDPKMTAPEGIRSVTGELKTKLPGVTFGGTFPLLAQHADKMAVVRSFAHRIGGHEQAHVHVLSGGTDPQGRQQGGFSIGSMFSRIRGANHPRSGLPTYVLMTEKEIDGQYRKEIGRVIKGSWPGSLGPAFAPFNHSIGWETKDEKPEDSKKRRSSTAPKSRFAENMKLNVPQERIENRYTLLREIDKLNRGIDATGNMDALDKFYGQAANLVLGGAADAFDLKKESPKLVERYDTGDIKIGHKVFRQSTLGKQMLVARRLCEAGCGFVTVHSAGWDMHADGNNPGIVKGMDMLGRSLDKAVSAFLEDVHQRGLSDKILLVVTGDFGRTPKVNKKGGRDHWARLGTLAFAGGGLNVGQVIGNSARNADVPATEPVTPAHLMGTVLHTLFDVGQLRLEPGVPRELIKIVEDARPVAKLL